MILGKQGVKYGLIKRETKQPVLQKRLAAFGDDDSEDEGRDVVAEQVKKQAAKKKTDARVCITLEVNKNVSLFIYKFSSSATVQQYERKILDPFMSCISSYLLLYVFF